MKKNHLPNFSLAKMIKYCNNLRLRKILESAVISTHKNYNHRPGPYNLAKSIAYKVIKENNINILNPPPITDNGG